MHSTWSKLASKLGADSARTAYWLGSKATELSLTPVDPEDGGESKMQLPFWRSFGSWEIRKSKTSSRTTDRRHLGSHGCRSSHYEHRRARILWPQLQSGSGDMQFLN